MTEQDLEKSLRPELDEALLGLDELALENPEEALSMFETLPEPVQALPEFQLALARTHQLMGQLEAARDLATGVSHLDPENADAHHLLGDLLEDLGKAEEANEHFRKTLALDEKSFNQHCEVPEGELRARLVEILTAAIKSLPDEIRTRVEQSERRVSLFPSAAEVEAGLDPRALTKWSASAGSAGAFVLYGANLDAEFGDLNEFDEFEPHVRSTIYEEIIEQLELSETESRRLGLVTNEEEPT